MRTNKALTSDSTSTGSPESDSCNEERHSNTNEGKLPTILKRTPPDESAVRPSDASSTHFSTTASQSGTVDDSDALSVYSSSNGGYTPSPCPSDAGSLDSGLVEYNGVVLDAFLFRAVRGAKDRLFLLKVDDDCQKLVESTSQTQLEYVNMNSYHRLMIHRTGQYFKLAHVADSQRRAITLYKTPESETPPLRLKDIPLDEVTLAPGESVSGPSGAVKIMQRRDHHHHRSHRHGSNDSGSDSSSKPKTIEEREAAYLAARARIFQEDAASDTSKDGQDASRRSHRPPSPTSSVSSDGARSQVRQHQTRKGPVNRTKSQPTPRNLPPTPPPNHRANLNHRYQQNNWTPRQNFYQPTMNTPYYPGAQMPFYPFPPSYAGQPPMQNMQPGFSGAVQGDTFYDWQHQLPPGGFTPEQAPGMAPFGYGYPHFQAQQSYGMHPNIPYTQSGPWQNELRQSMGAGAGQMAGSYSGQRGMMLGGNGNGALQYGSGTEHGTRGSKYQRYAGSEEALSHTQTPLPGRPPLGTPRDISNPSPAAQSPLHPQYTSNYPSLPTPSTRNTRQATPTATTPNATAVSPPTTAKQDPSDDMADHMQRLTV
ncbi:hypothetical protein HK097_005557 [Rhizophlyctis rosea]|uniref:SUZ domain-containing protein n=1 Tax=Rhizophlyctis rosea TaxID=64517 RepID=A0AAD5SR06_9FUNG|nr:hypothetical protein HK097_005557 [Rhizophlyctis rosea]